MIDDRARGALASAGPEGGWEIAEWVLSPRTS